MKQETISRGALTRSTGDGGLEPPGHGAGLAEADDDGGEDDLGAEDEAVHEAADGEHHPAPPALGIVVLLQSPQLPQLLVGGRLGRGRDRALVGDDDLRGDHQHHHPCPVPMVLELQTKEKRTAKVRIDFTITEKNPTSAFKFKTLLR